MKTYLAAAAFAALLAWPVAAFEKHELDLGEGEYNPKTGLTSYDVTNGICFTSLEGREAYAEQKGLVFVGAQQIGPYSFFALLQNEGDTYRELYLTSMGKSCLKAVAYAEGEPV